MIIVTLLPNESIDLVLRKFKQLCEKDNILSDIKKHEFYIKPSEKRKLKKKKFKYKKKSK